MSFADVITDMADCPAAMDVEGLPSSFKEHHGMSLCTKQIVNKLEELKIFSQLMEEYPWYDLVITVTSSGERSSANMAVILEQQSRDLNS